MDPNTPLYRSLSNDALHTETLEAAKREKQATLALLEFLAEVDERRLYSMRGYASLWEYTHLALGYSEAQASERVAAMRLMRKVPEVKAKLQAEELTLTSAAKFASFVRRENCSMERTHEILEKISEKSVRETVRVLATEQSHTVHRPDTMRPSGPETSRVSFDADPEFLALYEEVKNLQGRPQWDMNDRLKEAMKVFLHERKKTFTAKKTRGSRVKAGAASEGETQTAENASPIYPAESAVTAIVETLPTDRTLEKDPAPDNATPLIRASEVKSAAQKKADNDAPSDTVNRETVHCDAVHRRADTTKEKPLSVKSRYIPVEAQRAVRRRSGGRCEYVDCKTQRRCTSRFGLQFDHIVPFAQGGPSTLENLRHLCANHNRLAAVQVFGRAKMEPYFENSRRPGGASGK
jgi:5-methylcytosine-specific restriction endonuclease McrA